MTASCTFSKARTSIWRTRSRETPNSVESSSRVIGSRKAARLEDAALARIEHGQRVAQRREPVLAFLLCDEHAPGSAAVVDEPVLPLALALLAQGRVEGGVAAEPAVHVDHVLLGHAELGGDLLHLVGAQVAFLERRDRPFALRRLKNSFFWFAVVPIFTRDQDRRMYSWIAALIHHMA